MQTQNTSARRFTPLCFALVIASAALAASGTWIAFVPPSQDRVTVTVTGGHAGLGACISNALRVMPELAAAADRGSGTGPMISVLSHPGSDATRVMYEGPARLSFVVTLTEKSPQRTEARVLAFPAFDPGPVVEKAVRGCADATARTGAASKN